MADPVSTAPRRAGSERVSKWCKWSSRMRLDADARCAGGTVRIEASVWCDEDGGIQGMGIVDRMVC